MKFIKTKLKDAYIIQLEPKGDKRGFFARSYCKKEFKKHGIYFSVAQTNISYNRYRGTLRGMHYQQKPHEEAKLVGCIKGAIYDVIIDLRKGSVSYGKWISVELNETNKKMIYIPRGFAHGFQTLEPGSVLFYHMSEYYHPKSEKGIKWDDPKFAINWPKVNSRKISKKDRNYA